MGSAPVNATQLYEHTQMDIDQVGDNTNTMQQALANRTSKLDAIQKMDQKFLKKNAEKERQDKDKRI